LTLSSQSRSWKAVLSATAARRVAMIASSPSRNTSFPANLIPVRASAPCPAARPEP
jgi:hypothetical protein